MIEPLFVIIWNPHFLIKPRFVHRERAAYISAADKSSAVKKKERKKGSYLSNSANKGHS